ncbi:DUF5632 domain-containing protein [Mycobacterium tuberculosis]
MPARQSRELHGRPLRDDGTTTLLVTDLAGGWTRPHVRLPPANVTPLEPTARRRGSADVIDLLGAVVVAAHESNTYVAEPGPDAPARPVIGQRALGDTQGGRVRADLVEAFAVRRRDSPPRIAQAIALPAAAQTGVLENEAELLHGCITAASRRVLKAYPSHDHRGCRGLDAAGGDRGHRSTSRTTLANPPSPGLVCRNHQAAAHEARCPNRCPKLPDQHMRPDTVS